MLVDLNRRPIRGGAPKGVGRRRVLKTDAPKRKAPEPATPEEGAEIQARAVAIEKVLEEAWQDPTYYTSYLTSKSAYVRDDFYNLFNTVSGFKAPALDGNGWVYGAVPRNPQQVKAVVQLMQKKGSVSASEWEEIVFRDPTNRPDLDKSALAALKKQRNTVKTSWKDKQKKRILALWDIGKEACGAFIPAPTHEEIARHVFKFKPAHERE